MGIAGTARIVVTMIVMISLPSIARTQAKSERERIGVYIGIGAYTDKSTRPVEVHRTNLAYLIPKLSKRFGVTWSSIVLDEQATREGIREALLDLIDQVRERREAGVDVTAVVFYTGHGSRVQDQDGDEADEDGLDETWVTVNSSLGEGAEDVRDDDLYAFRHAILETGAELVMILESCHSQTAFRGEDGMRVMRGQDPVPGPSDPLFSQLSPPRPTRHKSSTPQMLDLLGEGERFICLAACQDSTLARLEDVSGKQWGRFSLALSKALDRIGPGDTYRRLHSLLLEEFSRQWAADTQIPMMYAGSPRYADAEFLGGRFPPAYWAVHQNNDGQVHLDGGLAAGFVPGTRVAIHRSASSVLNESEEGVICEALVQESNLLGATLQCELDTIPEGAVGTLVAVGLSDTSIYVDTRVAQEIRESLRAQADSGRMSLVSDWQDAVYVIEPCGAHVVLTTRDDSRMEAVDDPLAPPIPILVLDPSSYVDVEEMVDELVCQIRDVVRRQRFLSLVTNETDIAVSIRHDQESDRVVGGLTRLEEGEQFTLSIKNDSDERRYLYLFDWTRTAAGNMSFEFIGPGPARRMLGPGDEVHFKPTATLRRVGSEPPAEWDRTILKVIATSEPVSNIAKLVQPSCTRSGGLSDPFAQLLDEAMDGQRSGSSGADIRWSAMNLVFEIHRRSDDENQPN